MIKSVREAALLISQMQRSVFVGEPAPEQTAEAEQEHIRAAAYTTAQDIYPQS